MTWDLHILAKGVNNCVYLLLILNMFSRISECARDLYLCIATRGCYLDRALEYALVNFDITFKMYVLWTFEVIKLKTDLSLVF